MAELVQAPVSLAVFLTDAKEHVRIPHGDEDVSLRQYIEAATSFVQQRTNRQLITATYRLDLDGFPCGNAPIRLLPAPAQAVDSDATTIQYVAPDGTVTTLESDNYVVYSHRLVPLIRPLYGTVWPVTRDEPGSVRVTFVAGYGDSPADVPADLRQAVWMQTAHFWEYRESATPFSLLPVPFAVESILMQYEIMEVV